MLAGGHRVELDYHCRMLLALLKTMRPRQWTKNVFVFAALVFDKQLLIPESFLRTLGGFVLFCLVSSSVYIFNDLADIEADRQHPQKRYRAHPLRQAPCAGCLGGRGGR